jgi:O-succinylbenzoic acid--CoA ligase
MVGSAFATTSFFKLNESTQALLCLSCEHIAGKMMVARAFVSGMNLIVAEPSSLPLKHFLHQQIDFAAFVPMQIFMMLNDIRQQQKLQAIKNIIIGGSEISPSIKQQLNAFQNNIYETFGMTETVSHIALKLLSGNNEQPYFKTLDNIRVSKNENDCLVIDAPHLDNLPIVTNDIVRLIDEKTFEWIGRIDNVIVSGGLKFYAESIEQKLKPLIQQSFFVAGIPNEKLGTELVLIIENSNAIDEALLMPQITSVLTKYELPKKIFTLAEFVYTPNGKLNRTTTLKQLGRVM